MHSVCNHELERFVASSVGQVGDPQKRLAGQVLRGGVADLHRRCELSRKANEAYLEALAVVECPETPGMLAASVSQSLKKEGRRYRGLNLLQERDGLWLKAINRGEQAI